MKKQTFALCAGMSLLALAVAPSAFAASPTVTAGYTAAQLVDFLIPPTSSITIVGGSESFGTTTTGATPDLSQAGEFAGGSAANNLPFAAGVVLTTGRLSGATPINDTGILGPNDHNRTTHAWGTAGSTALESELLLPAGSTADAATLSFRFTSTANAFSFQYMFASEEYAENVNLTGNDGFAFLLTDMTTGTTVNLAKIGSSPVSVNTVNNGPLNAGPGVNASYYTANPVGSGGYDIEFDGMAGGAAANKLFASSSIIPGREYKIEMVIADAGNDQFVDSAVFIGADSFVDVPGDPVPEPATYVGALALAGLAFRKLRRKA